MALLVQTAAFRCSPRGFWVVLLCVGLAGCAGAGGSTAPTGVPDVPVPASEPREHLAGRIELERRSDCEETFDLGLYAHRGVDLVSWDANTGACQGRDIDVRYLPRKLSKPQLLQLVKQNSQSFSERK